MELKSLIIGLVFSVGIFAAKSGAGLSYLLKRESAFSKRFSAFIGFFSSYGLVFLLAWLVVGWIDLSSHLNAVMLFAKNGMTVHFLLAAVLLLWGVALLKKKGAPNDRSRGWLLLALPCPVCFSVILCSGAFLHNLFPKNPWLFAWLFTGFISASLACALCFVLFSKGNAEHGLGRIMVLAALYFLVTIAVVPQFSDFERIYRVSKATVILVDHRLPLLLAGISLAFAGGFIQTIRRPLWT
ncbi:MAG: DUF2162 family putative transporter [Pseudomonadota bacterium]